MPMPMPIGFLSHLRALLKAKATILTICSLNKRRFITFNRKDTCSNRRSVCLREESLWQHIYFGRCSAVSCVCVGCSPKCKQQIQEFKARESTDGSGNRKFSAHAIRLEYRAGGGALRHLAKGVGRGRLGLKNTDLEGLVNRVKESRL